MSRLAREDAGARATTSALGLLRCAAPLLRRVGTEGRSGAAILAALKLTRAAALAALLALMAGNAMAELATIEGTASYRERIALRPGAVLEVELLDVSRADAPSERLASIRIKAQGQVPIPFALHYDAAMIEPNRTYAVTAKLILQGKIVFRSDTVHPVLTRGAGDAVEILMVRTAAEDAARPGAAGAGDEPVLVGPTWVAEDIGSRGVIDDLQSHITFTAEGQAHGSGGCNKFYRRLQARRRSADARTAREHQEGLSTGDHGPGGPLPSGAGPDPRLSLRERPAVPAGRRGHAGDAALAPRLTHDGMIQQAQR